MVVQLLITIGKGRKKKKKWRQKIYMYISNKLQKKSWLMLLDYSVYKSFFFLVVKSTNKNIQISASLKKTFVWSQINHRYLWWTLITCIPICNTSPYTVPYLHKISEGSEFLPDLNIDISATCWSFFVVVLLTCYSTEH